MFIICSTILITIQFEPLSFVKHMPKKTCPYFMLQLESQIILCKPSVYGAFKNV